MIYAPFLYYRCSLEHSKRLRPIVEGKFYRSGCLTANGFRDAIDKHHIKTVISFWDENPDPTLQGSRLDHSTVKESDLCASMGVTYKFIYVKLRPDDPHAAIDEFLKIMDDESSYPVLIHCKAGLHRTGVMAAVYRMEYDGWTKQDAMRELRPTASGISSATRPTIISCNTSWITSRAANARGFGRLPTNRWRHARIDLANLQYAC